MILYVFSTFFTGFPHSHLVLIYYCTQIRHRGFTARTVHHHHHQKQALRKPWIQSGMSHLRGKVLSWAAIWKSMCVYHLRRTCAWLWRWSRRQAREVPWPSCDDVPCSPLTSWRWQRSFNPLRMTNIREQTTWYSYLNLPGDGGLVASEGSDHRLEEFECRRNVVPESKKAMFKAYLRV